MTHNTDAERADCPVCGGRPFVRRSHDADGMRWSHVECKSCGLRTRGKWAASSSDECPIFFQEVWEEWPRRAPAAPVPQGWKLVPVESTEAMARAFRADDAPGYFCMTTLRCADFSERYAAMLAAAPHPPEAAPVELPEPAAWRDPKNLLPSQGCTYEKSTAKKWAHIYTEALYTEQQVRELLAANGIKVNQ